MKIIKKTLALVLSLIIICSLSSVCFAANGEQSLYPVLFIPGFGQSETKVYSEGGEYLGDVASFDLPGLNDVSSIVKEVITPVLLSSLTRKDVNLSQAVVDAMDDIFKPFSLNDDGSYVYKRVIRRFNKPYSELSKEDQAYIYSKISLNGLDKAYDDVRYYYTYDSFGSIETAAKELHEYIHEVILAQTNADKIDIVPISQGGTVFAMYLDMYPEDYKYIRKVVNMIPAFDGSEIVGDIMTDDVTIYDIDELHESILPSLLGENDTTYLISIALRLALSTDTLQEVLKAALNYAKSQLVVKSSAMWALCPSDDYEKVKEEYLSDAKYSTVYAETERYALARRNLVQNIETLMANGTVVHTLAFYNQKYLISDLIGSSKNNCDGLLAVSSPSLGATAAPLGNVLGSDYLTNAVCTNQNHNHISPDQTVDASTGAFPENTWYIKNASHIAANSREDVKNFAAKLITDDTVTDIYSYEGYSQFIDFEDYIASSKVVDGYNYYYDKDGNYMYKEKTESSTESGFSFWKIPYTLFNICFRILHSKGFGV